MHGLPSRLRRLKSRASSTQSSGNPPINWKEKGEGLWTLIVRGVVFVIVVAVLWIGYNMYTSFGESMVKTMERMESARIAKKNLKDGSVTQTKDSKPSLSVDSVWNWHSKHRPSNIWMKENLDGTITSRGKRRFEYVCNLALLDGGMLTVKPQYGFGNNSFVKKLNVVDSSGDIIVATTNDFDSKELAAKIGPNMDLAWMGMESRLKKDSKARAYKLGYEITPPKSNVVRVAYRREFCADGQKSDYAAWTELPFVITKDNVDFEVNFDLSIVLSRLPSPKTGLKNTKPWSQINMQPVEVAIVRKSKGDKKFTYLYRTQFRTRSLTLRSEDIRSAWKEGPNEYANGVLWICCRQPLIVHVAVRIGGRHR